MKKTVYIACADEERGDSHAMRYTFNRNEAINAVDACISHSAPRGRKGNDETNYYVSGYHIDCLDCETAQEAWDRFSDECDWCVGDPDLCIPCNYGVVKVDGREYALKEKPYFANGTSDKVFRAEAICIDEECAGFNTWYNITWNPEEDWLHRDDEDFDGYLVNDKFACDWNEPDSAELVRKEKRIF